MVCTHHDFTDTRDFPFQDSKFCGKVWMAGGRLKGSAEMRK